MRFKRYSLCTVLFVALMVLWVAPTMAGEGAPKAPFAHNPVIFVHGSSGSASQFESQAMRFAQNGYPKNYLYAHEYDSTFTINTWADVHTRLDALIDQVLAATGAEQVDIMAHSLGTVVMMGNANPPRPGYLQTPERAARVGPYVSIDGQVGAALPGGVPTLALWASHGTAGRTIVGAENVILENQTHVQAATSAEAFGHMYRFLTGSDPGTTAVMPDFRGHISVSGRAVLFPQNIGVEGALLQIYEISGASGQRLCKKPAAQYTITADGNWGPFKAKAGRCYELVLVREGLDHHFYKEPFIRSDPFVRLNASPLGGGVGANMDFADGQSNLVVSRDKESWGDQGVQNTILAVNGVNIVNAATCPITKRTTTFFVYDLGSDEASSVEAPIAYFHSLSFLTGVDLFIPAADPPDNRIRLTLMERGGNGTMQVINVPNWSSTSHRISVQFNDFAQWDNIPR
ncbi:MAG: alpha/beta hydrolase [Desulfobacterales bacterium]|nr:alpha/beta hydrolase [Desulfobacterales bacterium]